MLCGCGKTNMTPIIIMHFRLSFNALRKFWPKKSIIKKKKNRGIMRQYLMEFLKKKEKEEGNLKSMLVAVVDTELVYDKLEASVVYRIAFFDPLIQNRNH